MSVCSIRILNILPKKLFQEKPEWILQGYQPSSKRTADPRSYALGCALDYTVQGVRDWLFSLMEEVANQFDIDGLEFNYTRLPPPGSDPEPGSLPRGGTEFLWGRRGWVFNAKLFRG